MTDDFYVSMDQSFYLDNVNRAHMDTASQERVDVVIHAPIAEARMSITIHGGTDEASVSQPALPE